MDPQTQKLKSKAGSSPTVTIPLEHLQKLTKAMRENQQLSEEINFYREQEIKNSQKFQEYQKINQRLRQRLEKYEPYGDSNPVASSNQKSRQIKGYEPKKNDQNCNKENVFVSIQNTDSQHFSSRKAQTPQKLRCKELNESYGRQSCLSGQDAKGVSFLARENHASTPKSKFKIDLGMVIPSKIDQRRKVFL